MFKTRSLLILGLLSLLLVAMAVSRPLAKAPTSAELSWPPRPVIASADNLAIQRSRSADSARWTAMGEYYQSQRRLAADSARWTKMAEYFHSIESAYQGRMADALRLTGMAEYYQNISKARHLNFA